MLPFSIKMVPHFPVSCSSTVWLPISDSLYVKWREHFVVYKLEKIFGLCPFKVCFD